MHKSDSYIPSDRMIPTDSIFILHFTNLTTKITWRPSSKPGFIFATSEQVTIQGLQSNILTDLGIGTEKDKTLLDQAQMISVFVAEKQNKAVIECPLWLMLQLYGTPDTYYTPKQELNPAQQPAPIAKSLQLFNQLLGNLFVQIATVLEAEHLSEFYAAVLNPTDIPFEQVVKIMLNKSSPHASATNITAAQKATAALRQFMRGNLGPFNANLSIDHQTLIHTTCNAINAQMNLNVSLDAVKKSL